MKRFFLCAAVLALSPAPGCGDVVVPDSSTTDDGGSSGTTDTGNNTTGDTSGGDAQADNGSGPDVTVDAQPDVLPDGTPDLPPDVPPEIAPDIPDPLDAPDTPTCAGPEQCDDGDPCTIDGCQAGACVHLQATDVCQIGETCYADGAVDPGDVCQFCDIAAATDAWTAVTCSDDNPCTEDACDPVTGCDYPPDDSASCDDGKACSGDDHCDAGTCVGTCVCEIDAQCDGKIALGPCERAVCLNYDCVATSDAGKDGEACSAGDLCVEGGVCNLGACVGATPKDCSPASDGPCKPGACNPANGQCVTDTSPNGMVCSDLDACTEGDQCTNGQCVGATKDCATFDGPCSTGACEGGQCVATINGGQACDPGNPCVLEATCTEEGACSGQWDTENCPCTEDTDCVDAFSCTQAFCSQETGSCQFPLVPNSCLIEGICYFGAATNPATVCQRCDPAVNPNAWTEVVCNDNNPCTEDSCDVAQGCVGTPDDALTCDDGDPCSSDDHCEGGSCAGTCECVEDSDCAGVELPIPPRFCQHTVCTNFKCVVVADAAKDGAGCDDTDACTTGEVCGGGTCAAGVAVSCDAPADSCSSVACNPTTGACDESYADAGVGCNDGDACTVEDLCDGTGGCAGTLKDCSAFADDCNAAECVNGACIPSPLDGVTCDDLDACTVDDSCTNGTCAGDWNGTDPTCGCNNDDSFCNDNLPCTINTCAPSGQCITTVKSGQCYIGGGCFIVGDTNPQNACQRCTALSSNTWQGIVCDDAKPCTDDACDPASGCTAVDDDSNACNDSDPCSSDDHCAGGQCVGTCECTTDAQCTETAPTCKRYTCSSYSCVLVADAAQDGSLCEDGNYCSVNDSCVAGACVGGGQRDCSEAGDGNCTVGICDALSESCVTDTKPNGDLCDDGNKCTDDDDCNAGVCAGVAIDCGAFEDECNLGQCDAQTGQCESTPTPGESCSDGDACTLEDGCTQAGTCVGTWDDVNCGCDGDDDCAGFTNTCNTGRCDLANHSCYGEPKVGTACNDSELCTVDDQCNEAGQCAGSPYTCDDELGCTDNLCDGQGGCTFPLKDGRCLINGTCYAGGQTNPSNVCQICQGGAAWGANDGATCNDQEACTKDDVCQGQQCNGTDYSCDDEIGCTFDVCLGNGSCEHSVGSSECVIDGVCVFNGSTNPNNGCESCHALTSQYAWTPNNNACDDDDNCTKDDFCSGGHCGGSAYSCVDGQPCTEDNVCDGEGGCTYPLLDGWCRIGITCVGDGQPRPGSECQYCDASAATGSWTNRSTTTTCDDGLPCTSSSTCNAVGVCEGEIDGCNPDSCETATCTETGCEISLRPGWCKIEGTCYGDGDEHPNNTCLRCIADQNTAGWTPNSGDTCNDGELCTSSDKCSNGQCTGSPYGCETEYWCVDTACAGDGSCDETIQAGTCLIGGACYQGGAYHPNNECQQCEPGSSQTSWVNRSGSCTDDGLTCTTDACSSGQCAHSYTAINKECLIGGVCWASASTNPQNECQYCDYVNGPVSWSSKSSGSACDSDDEPCTDDLCNGAGSCLHTALADFTSCSDGDNNTSSDWCWAGTCDGFERSITHTGYDSDEEYQAASPAISGGVHGAFNRGCTGSFCFPGWATDRYDGSLTPVAQDQIAGISASPMDLNSGFMIWGNAISWYDSGNDKWEIEGGVVTEWALLPTTAQFHGLTPNGILGVRAAGWNTSSELAFVRNCSWWIFSGWACKDDPVESWAADNLRKCPGWGVVDGEPFAGCEYWTSSTDAGPSYHRILKFNAATSTWDDWEANYFGSTSGKTINDFGSAGRYLIGVGDTGALVVTLVNADLSSGGDTSVTISGFPNQPISDFSAVANAQGRAWVVGSYISGSPFQVQTMFVAHGDETANLKSGSNWRVHTLYTVSSLCFIGQPCGVLGQDYKLSAVAGDDDELYLFGAWFDSVNDRRNKAVWRRSMP